MNKTFAKYSFNFANQNKNVWLLKAEELMHSAIILRDISITASTIITKLKSGEVVRGSETEKILKNNFALKQATMLFGFAIENALKGLWVDKYNVDLETPIEKLPAKLKQHDLVKLAKDVGINLSSSEIKVLGQFTTNILWEGRYPIPLNYTQYSNYLNTKPAFFVENKSKEELPKDIVSILDKIRKKFH